MLEKAGEILWYMIFFNPLIIIPIVWTRYSNESKRYRIFCILGSILLFSSLCFFLSMIIILRNGLGPT